ncbi:hypothetical protein F4604DRAFT_1935076 [Suillus subluteus]|nr:hypothetical protein F4604DRAFT_1935076 [Suillus subluteus]
MGPPVSIRNNITPGPSVIIEDILNMGPWSAGPSCMGYYVRRVACIIRNLSLKGLLGWGQTVPEIQSDGTSSRPEDDEPSYYLGWGGFSSDEQPMDEDSAELDDEDSPAYNLGWGVGATSTNQDVIDLTNDNGLMSQGNNVIDLTRSSPGPMDLDRDKSPGGTMEHDSVSSARHFMFHYNCLMMPVVNDPTSPAKRTVLRANCWMKAIGHDMSDQHVHAVVENAVHGLNSDQVPAQILMANRWVLNTFADA